MSYLTRVSFEKTNATSCEWKGVIIGDQLITLTAIKQSINKHINKEKKSLRMNANQIEL